MTNLKLRNHVVRTLQAQGLDPQPEGCLFAKTSRSPWAQCHSYNVFLDEAKINDVVSKIIDANPDYSLISSEKIRASDEQTIYVSNWMSKGCLVTVVGPNPRRKYSFSTDYN